MRSREGKLEDYFEKCINELGGVTYKWTPPRGLDGVPDRIVMLGGRAWFVEMKNSDGRLRPSQKNLLPKMAEHHPIYVVYGYEAVDEFIKTMNEPAKGLIFIPESKRKQLERKK